LQNTEPFPRHVYLACPCDNRGESSVTADAEFIMLQLQRAGLNVFAPGMGWAISASCDGMFAVNDFALRQSAGLFALLSRDAVSVGVPMEIQIAHELGLPVTVAMDFMSNQLLSMGIEVYRADDAAALDEAIRKFATKVRHYVEEHPAPAAKSLRVAYTNDFEGREKRLMLPSRTYGDDAGLDLFIQEETVVKPGEFRDIRCGVRVELPEGVWGMVTGRSSAIRTHRLLVVQGVIDTGFRGELLAPVINMGDRPVTLWPGMRLAQLILIENATARFGVEEVAELAPSARGTNGFGSSGR
jgi:dUTP pyrophosphatase